MPQTPAPLSFKDQLLRRLAEFKDELINSINNTALPLADVEDEANNTVNNKVLPPIEQTKLYELVTTLYELVTTISNSEINSWLNSVTTNLSQLKQLIIQLANNRRALERRQSENNAQLDIVCRAYTHCIRSILLELRHPAQNCLQQLASHMTKEELELIGDELDFVITFRTLEIFTTRPNSTDVLVHLCDYFYSNASHPYEAFNCSHIKFNCSHIKSEETILYQLSCLREYASDSFHQGIKSTHIVVKGLSLIDDDVELTDTIPSKPLTVVISEETDYLNRNEALSASRRLIGKILAEDIQEVTISSNSEKPYSLLYLQKYAASLISSIILYTPVRSVTVAMSLPLLDRAHITEFLLYNQSITDFQIEGFISKETQEVLAANRRRQHAPEIVTELCQEQTRSLADIYHRILPTTGFPPVAYCIAWALKGPDDKVRKQFQYYLSELRKDRNNEALNHYYQAVIKQAETLINDETKTLNEVYQYLDMVVDDSVPHYIDELHCSAWAVKKRIFPNDDTEPNQFLLYLSRATEKLIAKATKFATAHNSKLHADCIESFKDICDYFRAYRTLTSDFAFKTLFPLINDPAHPFCPAAIQTVRGLVSVEGELKETPEQKQQRLVRLIIVYEHIKLDENSNIVEWIKVYFKDLCQYDSALSAKMQTLADIRTSFPEHYLKLQVAILEEKKRLKTTDENMAVTRLEILETAAILKRTMKLERMATVLRKTLNEDSTALLDEITDITRLPMFYNLRQALSNVSDVKDDASEKSAQAETINSPTNKALAEFCGFMAREDELGLDKLNLISNSAGKCILATLAALREWEFMAQLISLTCLTIDLDSVLFRKILSEYEARSVNFYSQPAQEAFRVLIAQAKPPRSKPTTTQLQLPVNGEEPFGEEHLLFVCLKAEGCLGIFSMLVEKGFDPNIKVEHGSMSILLYALCNEKYRQHAYALLEKSSVPVRIPAVHEMRMFGDIHSLKDPRLLAGFVKHGFDPTSMHNPQPTDKVVWKQDLDTYNAVHNAACTLWNSLHPKMQALEDENARLKRELAELKQRNSPGLFKAVVSETSGADGAGDQKEGTCLPSLPVTVADQPGCNGNVTP